ncbi:MAG: NF038129 family PEP-CTERM protein [Pseudomonadota bacterium]
MFNSLRHALLACALLLCNAVAFAGPTYLVTLHTQDYAGESGLLDFGMGGTADAPSAFAYLWHFAGAFGEEFDRSASTVGDLAGGVTVASTGASNYLTQAVSLGGDLSFYVNFSGDYQTLASGSGNLFAVVLYSEALTDMWAIAAEFALQPAFNGAPASVLVDANAELATVTDVPEPSQLLLMLSALALAGVALRRKA